jgi:G3E family GTPase
MLPQPGLKSPIPVTILAGFLGAGKTTLLNRILSASHGLRLAVLVNDFGELNIDSQLVVGVQEDTISLANGCICCTIRDDLLATALQVVGRPDPPEYILIETSGVSDPGAVAATFLLPQMRSVVRLDSVIALADAEQVLEQRDYSPVLLDQIAAADIVLLNKTDLASQAQRDEVREWIRTIVPRARILETVHAEAPLQLLLGVGLGAADRGPVGDVAHNHAAEFSTWSFQSERPFQTQAVNNVFKRLPPTIFRAKGILAVAESDRRVILQMAGRHTRLIYGEAWGGARPRTQMVMIGTPGGLDPADLAQRFEACLVTADLGS